MRRGTIPIGMCLAKPGENWKISDSTWGMNVWTP